MRGILLKRKEIIHFTLTGVLLLAFSSCEKALNLKNTKTNPVAVFDDTWNMMDKHYALFSIKGINWSDSYTEYRARVTNDMTDKALFKVISNMLETLKDGHVTLISPSDTSTYESFYKTYPINFNYKNVINYYLKNDYKISGPAIYKVENNVGYIYYNSFKNDISDEQVDKIFSEMKNTKGLIIDVRNNQGGKSENADKLFKRFISEKKLVKYEVTKKGSAHDDFFDPKPFYLSPTGNYYKNPVCVLTNRSCFSACNDFVLYMSELTNVKLIGDQTGGGGGIPYNYLLPNGWKIQYTATITLSPEKLNIENGIQPTIAIGITPLDESNGKDPILEKAFLLLQ
jgi:Peptidase family S41/Tricorn protease C1 domain